VLRLVGWRPSRYPRYSSGMAPFAKGKPRPPASGRRKGVPNRGTLRARRLVAEADDKDIVATTVREAKTGNMSAQAIYFRYLRPPRPKLNPTPVEEIDKPATVEQVRSLTADLLVRALRGELDLDAATTASALLKTIESSIVGFDLATLLEELKLKAKQQGRP
jgi:hypothetical protein